MEVKSGKCSRGTEVEYFLEKELQGKSFPCYIPTFDVTQGLDTGKLLKASFHVNAYDQRQAYCKIDGRPNCLLVTGALPQNRAIEGDTVAVEPDPKLLGQNQQTGRVVAIIQKSCHRESILGHLCLKEYNHSSILNNEYIMFSPIDPKFPEMKVRVGDLPKMNRLEAGDMTIQSYLVAAKVKYWYQECPFPVASVIQIWGSVIWRIPWKVPQEELWCRTDLRKLKTCIFTIDPVHATDLDDALSVEILPNGVSRVGVHVPDVSCFVLPNSPLDFAAQIQSNSVYLAQGKLSMLPSMVSNELASINPGVDRLAFTMFWDINSAGQVLDRWVGRTIVRSCCRLSYDQAQEVIDGTFDFQDSPELYGQFEWSAVVKSVKMLNHISKVLRGNRFRDGLLSLEKPKIVFLFDEEGMPCDNNMVYGRRDSDILVEEFMVLANRTAAEVITKSLSILCSPTKAACT